MTVARTFLCPKPNKQTAVRLFCFPYAGGSSTTFLSWAGELENDVELQAYQPPGRGARFGQPAHDSMNDVVEELLCYADFITEKPYILLGHSLGSRVVFELALRFKRLGKRAPLHIIASGSQAPHIPLTKESIYQLPDKEFVEALASLNGTPEEVLSNQELMGIFMPVLRADFKIADNYVAESHVLDCPFSVLTGLEDKGVSEEGVQAWQQLSSYDINLHYVEGDHFYIDHNKNQVLPVVNKILRDTLTLHGQQKCV